MSDTPLAPILQTVQDVPNALKNESVGGLFFWGARRGPILPAWGDREREHKLRAYYLHDRNTLVQGAFAGVAKKIASTPWEVEGPGDVGYWQDLLRQAQFGAGWGDFCKRLALNFLRHDIGTFVEVIGPGDPRGPLIGPATGLAVLESLRCYPTGDPIYPVIYTAAKGEYHLMHHSRVLHLVDMCDGTEINPGIGLCALSRAIALVQQQILMGRYVDQYLDDRPKPSFLISSNVSKKDLEAAMNEFWWSLNADTRDPMGNYVRVYGTQTDQTAAIDVIPFSEAPEKFDYIAYTEMHVKALALAIGVDPQDLWELTSQQLGSATQSNILATKARGKTEGDLRTEIERALNDVLPLEYEFTFGYQDAQEDLDRAQVRAANAGALQTVAASLSTDEIRAFLVATDETFRDILTDDAGRINRLTDVDPEPSVLVAADAAPVGAAPPLVEVAPALEEKAPALQAKAKAWVETRAMFIRDFSDLLRGRLSDEVSGRRFSTVLRAQLHRLGAQAFRDGLQAGGVAVSELDQEDRQVIADWTANQGVYVSGLVAEIRERGLSQSIIGLRAEMWANKSLREIYSAGLTSAQRNGMMKWVLGPTEKHCKDCPRLNGQVHRARDWEKRGLFPGCDKTECKGFNCLCQLVPTTEKARGRF